MLGGTGLQEIEGVAAAWFEAHQCFAAIVRPDHYVYCGITDLHTANQLWCALQNAMRAESVASETNRSALLYSGDGRYLIEAGPDRTVQIWDAAHQRLLQRIGLDAKAAAISADSRFLAIASGDALTVWQLR